jgi:hypothetical protein
MVADPIVERASSGVIAGIATATSTASVVVIVHVIVTGNTIDGVVGDRHS